MWVCSTKDLEERAAKIFVGRENDHLTESAKLAAVWLVEVVDVAKGSRSQHSHVVHCMIVDVTTERT